ncbi:MAG: putative metal-binding motif-containing protein, partial [Myxococcaceae bacterium]
MQLRIPFLAIALATLFTACGPGPKPGVQDSGTTPSGPNCIDNDGDGAPGTGDCSAAPIVDCNDKNPAVHPGATEVCNGIDDNCQGQADEALEVASYYLDGDGDGYGTAEVTGSGCAQAPTGSAAKTGDCNDSNPTVNPGASEVCNAVDDDCNTQVDDTLTFQDFYPDLDSDGYGDQAAAAENSCQASIQNKVANKGDCADQDPTVRPGATELCNKADDNCDGQVDNGVSYSDYYPDVDGDGHGDSSATAESSCSQVPGKVQSHTDCNDASPSVHPGAAETCNAVDDNCSGAADEGLTFLSYYPDSDGDGYGAGSATAQSACLPVAGKVANNQDCDDTAPAVHPGGTELCNGVDDNCNTQLDEGLTFLSYYPDTDGDSYGDKTAPAASSCIPVAGKVATNGDC